MVPRRRDCDQQLVVPVADPLHWDLLPLSERPRNEYVVAAIPPGKEMLGQDWLEVLWYDVLLDLLDCLDPVRPDLRWLALGLLPLGEVLGVEVVRLDIALRNFKAEQIRSRA